MRYAIATFSILLVVGCSSDPGASGNPPSVVGVWELVQTKGGAFPADDVRPEDSSGPKSAFEFSNDGELVGYFPGRTVRERYVLDDSQSPSVLRMPALHTATVVKEFEYRISELSQDEMHLSCDVAKVVVDANGKQQEERVPLTLILSRLPSVPTNLGDPK